jgi:hypothetical protein
LSKCDKRIAFLYFKLNRDSHLCLAQQPVLHLEVSVSRSYL